MADIGSLRTEIDTLIDQVSREAGRDFTRWQGWDIRPPFEPSAANLAAYLALRHRDLRGLQRALMPLGLSSLGRLESRVMPSLHAVSAALAAMDGQSAPGATAEDFFAGEERLSRRTHRLFGLPRHGRPAALLVTAPGNAGDGPDFMHKLASRQVDAIRINCAHDGPEQWAAMIAQIRAAEAATGHRMRVFMDLGGPKLRTGAVTSPHGVKRVFPGDRIALIPPCAPHAQIPADVSLIAECTLPEALMAAEPGQRVLIDDGKIATVIDQQRDGVAVLSITRCKEEGAKLKPEKGINLPDTELRLPALTAKDRLDLEFAARHADAIEFSFVQTAEDVAELQAELERLRPRDWTELALVLKIETARAIHNLPDIIVRAAARQPVAVMIARGDLAIEIGFPRLAEMQEEILWIAEAAQVPVIWATQVLEQLVKEGLPHRGELTDAAMAARAECVMLNKGPFLFEAIDALDALLGRMDNHLHKKTPQLRRLSSW